MEDSHQEMEKAYHEDEKQYTGKRPHDSSDYVGR
jgi:hypothetical protein